MLKTKMYVGMYEIRNYCIEKNYYTNGTNEEYERLLDSVGYGSEVTLSDLERIADDIIDKTDFSDKYKQGYKYIDLLEMVTYDLINDVVTHCIERV